MSCCERDPQGSPLSNSWLQRTIPPPKKKNQTSHLRALPKLPELQQLGTTTTAQPDPPLTYFCTIPLDLLLVTREKCKDLWITQYKYMKLDYFTNFIPPKGLQVPRSSHALHLGTSFPKLQNTICSWRLKAFQLTLNAPNSSTSAFGSHGHLPVEEMLFSHWNICSVFRLFSSGFTPKAVLTKTRAF